MNKKLILALGGCDNQAGKGTISEQFKNTLKA